MRLKRRIMYLARNARRKWREAIVYLHSDLALQENDVHEAQIFVEVEQTFLLST